ncbi:S-layer homology domain-containing protein [Cohnella nanjingensis]|uniref:S-layer homology domain-containing protein n=1 Tax=Cohnella nanjingensis TaxID=1387779 RepID=A0A7X0VF36_9BACL|nr:S-layer homology domain-containing protein [Cohnella nanjingensis]MBB6670209.1 S-layer homology domain-containing protein [Cohnella nanjingensis]
MNNKFNPKRLLALLLAAFLVLPAFQQAGQASAAEASSSGALSGAAISHYDYFSDVYPNLNDLAHVFKTLTYEDLVHVLDSDGTYAILFGGASIASTQANIGYINEVAKAYGVKTVYNFDTKLDGATLDIADSANRFANVYTDLVNKYLTERDPSGAVVAPSPAADVKDASLLFVYNKNHKNGGNSEPILASLRSDGDESDYLTDGSPDAGKIDAFKADVLGVLQAASSYDSVDAYDFIAPAFNANVLHNTTGQPPIFDGSDRNLVFEHVTYHELTKLLASQGNYAILFGGSWCPNTQAAIKFINEYAKKYNVDKVYMWDPRLDAGVDVSKPAGYDTHENDRLMVRDTRNAYARLYVDLVNTYLTNIQTQYLKTSNNVNYPGPNGEPVVANKLQVPYFFIYNKDNKDENGKAAPIFGHVELMYGWKTIQPGAVNANNQPYLYNETYKAALDSVLSRLESVPTGLTGLAPTGADSGDGRIVGVNGRPLEYKLAGASTYLPANGASITGLVYGTYDVRYVSKPGYQGPVAVGGVHAEVAYPAGQSIQVVVPAPIFDQAPPTGLSGIAPTTPANDDGQITGTTTDLEYKFEDDDIFLPATAPSITGLVYGTYQVRVAAKPGYRASPIVEVVIPAYGELGQDAPTGLSGIAPSAPDAADGQIIGVTEGQEYKLASAKDYIPVTGTAITGLTPGSYLVRFAAKPGYSQSPAVEVVVPAYENLDQAAPTGLTGIAPTSAANNDGQITGTSDGQEFKLHGDSIYRPATVPAIRGLAAGTYHVRFAAKLGYNASPDAEVVVPAYVSPGVPGGPSGPSTPTPPPTPMPPPIPVDPADPTKAIIGTTVASKTDAATGVTTAAITAAAVQDLLSSAKTAEASGKTVVIAFKVEPDAASKSVELLIPRSAFGGLAADTKAELKFDYGKLGALVFDAKSVAGIQSASNAGDIIVKIAVSELTEEGKQALGDRPVYDFNVFAGDSAVASFGGGRVSVSLPYTLKAGEDPQAVVVYHINEAGELITLRGGYHAATGTVDFATTHFSEYIIGHNAVPFADVAAGTWYKDAVSYLAARSITTGTDETHYSPNATVTRGQFIVLLLKAYGIAPDEQPSDNFADAGNAYYTKYLAAAKRLGITEGLGDNKYQPDSQVTRQELFTLLYRALGTLGELPAAKSNVGLSGFSDAGSIAGYAQDAFQSLVDGGIVTGSGGKLNPKDVSTRAQVAQVLYNLLSK